jgi:hypothetical protein
MPSHSSLPTDNIHSTLAFDDRGISDSSSINGIRLLHNEEGSDTLVIREVINYLQNLMIEKKSPLNKKILEPGIHLPARSAGNANFNGDLSESEISIPFSIKTAVSRRVSLSVTFSICAISPTGYFAAI